MAVFTLCYDMIQEPDLFVNETVGSFPAMVLVVLLCPLTPDAQAQFRTLVPNILDHGAQMHPQDADALVRGKHHDEAGVGVLKVNQMIDARSGAHRNPIG